MLKARQILIALYNKYNGNWMDMYEHISEKKEMDENPDLTGENELITLLDADYPEDLKKFPQPPFVITKEECELKEYELPVVFKIQAHNLKQATQIATSGDIDFDNAKLGKVRLAK